MSFGKILKIIEEKDFVEHNKKIRKEVLKVNKWLLNPRSLNRRKMLYVFRFLSKNAERKILNKHLNDLQFLFIHIAEKPKENRINDLKKYYNLLEEDVSMIKFLMYPKKFPPGGYEEKLKKYGIELYSPSVIFKKLPFKDYIDLYALMTYIPLDEKNPFIQNLLDEILKIDPLQDKKSYFKKVIDIYKSLNDFEKHILNIQLKNFSYYHYKLFNTDSIKGIVIDGSNVVRYEDKDSLQFLIDMLDNMFFGKIVFFPVHIVFDNNVKHFLSTEDRKVLELLAEKKRVYFNSPADEMIVYISNKYDYYILSNDNFKEYDVNENKLLKIKDFKFDN
ncbi:hypothetical protein SAMN02745164_01954 [Marinitoga hydrogenitolerans DSM 16785]|uniref:RNase NYN domain-containing protein n=1 Tax=Marinitoga hydrogenitolerans (strain DSM 16785 / JCM 12826 / AT1271) TaxID=1122195 RepID=A0A1M4ZJY9_MARH1|nr:hypothetical protein [Marinitoga hydrogenitolerans]SHF18359.1 hypothetical protein SAMN02745164_01954 [Marinitoga hydrogenitolerans DSM 16785]